ncbi:MULTISPECIES: hypothetical protein [unclassified Moraxella]|uniref:hypothetical protein n=1 Tax=unclassified Moraxella TaxID=2685852 RepID=UPI003AF5B459
MPTPTQPLNQDQLNEAQTTKANKAMDGIQPTDINQDSVPNAKQANTEDSLLDMMKEAKSN